MKKLMFILCLIVLLPSFISCAAQPASNEEQPASTEEQRNEERPNEIETNNLVVHLVGLDKSITIDKGYKINVIILDSDMNSLAETSTEIEDVSENIDLEFSIDINSLQEQVLYVEYDLYCKGNLLFAGYYSSSGMVFDKPFAEAIPSQTQNINMDIYLPSTIYMDIYPNNGIIYNGEDTICNVFINSGNGFIESCQLLIMNGIEVSSCYFTVPASVNNDSYEIYCTFDGDSFVSPSYYYSGRVCGDSLTSEKLTLEPFDDLSISMNLNDVSYIEGKIFFDQVLNINDKEIYIFAISNDTQIASSSIALTDNQGIFRLRVPYCQNYYLIVKIWSETEEHILYLDENGNASQEQQTVYVGQTGIKLSININPSVLEVDESEVGCE